jgi:hypothetical protein
MDTFLNGPEVQLNSLDELEFSDPAEKWKNWTGKCSRIASRSTQWMPPAGRTPSTPDWLNVAQVVNDDFNQSGSWLDAQQVSQINSRTTSIHNHPC